MQKVKVEEMRGKGGGGFVEVILMLFTSALVLSFARAQKGSRT